jgi:dipeptidyl aminopeptidase/acylaminoacyl peptidase
MIFRSLIRPVHRKTTRSIILVLAVIVVLLLALRAGSTEKQPGPKEAGQRPRGLGFRCVAFSPDGKLIAASTGEPNELGELIVLDAATGKRLFVHGETTGIPSVTFSPDGKTLAIALYDQTAKLLEAATGQERLVLRGHTKEVRGIAFSPDGKTLATGSWDRAVKLWDVASGSEIRTLEGYKDRIYSVTFSPDGQALVATGYGREAPVLDVHTGQMIRTISHGGFAVRAATFTRDGRWLLTGGYEGTVRVWDARTGEMRCRLKNLGGVDALAYAPAARTLATGGNGKSIQLFELSSDEPTLKERERIRTLLDKLDENAYTTREEASKELLQVGPVAEPELRRAGWRPWWEENKPYLFFSDTGGYRWYIDPLAKKKAVPTKELQGSARASLPAVRQGNQER